MHESHNSLIPKELDKTNNTLSALSIVKGAANAKTILKQTIDASESFHNRIADKPCKENKFPIDVFPSLFKKIITESERSLNFPIDYTAIAILTAASIVIGKSAKLRVKSIWYEYPSIWGVLIGPSGVVKTHPITMANKPLEDIDRKSINEFAKSYDEYETYQNLSKKDRPKEAPEKPVLKKTLLHNFTPEALYIKLQDNDRGCMLVSEEISTWIEGMNNFSKGDTTSIYLSIWSNQSTSVDRIKNPKPLWLPTPFLSIIGGTQPRLLTRIFPANKTDNGFFQRFLIAFPDNVKKEYINDFDFDETVLTDYADWMKIYMQRSEIIIDADSEMPKPKIYVWSDAAKKFFYKWQKENTDKVNKYPNSLKSEIISKFDIHFCRLSLILHIMEDYESREISLNAVQGAEKLCTYFLNCALKVLEVIGKQTKADGLPDDKRELYNALPDKFTTGQGVIIAESLNIPERTFKTFIENIELFRKPTRGVNEKIK